jgi:hypothetical protein
MLPLRQAPELLPPGKNTAFENEERRRDCAVLSTEKLVRGYSNAQAGDAFGFAEAIEDMFARFEPHIQVTAIHVLRIEFPKWMPQPGEVYHVCDRLAAEEFRRQRRETQIKQQLEARRADETAGLPYLRPKAIAGPAAAPVDGVVLPPAKPSDEGHEARDSQIRPIWRLVAEGRITEEEAEQRIRAIKTNSPIAPSRSAAELS